MSYEDERAGPLARFGGQGWREHPRSGEPGGNFKPWKGISVPVTLPQQEADSRGGRWGGVGAVGGILSLADIDTLAGSDLGALWGPTSPPAQPCPER